MSSAARVLAAAIAATIISPALSQAKPPPRPAGLMESFDAVDTMCGEVGSPVTQATSCAERDKLRAIIKLQGWCKGRGGQSESDRQWHRCGPKSL